VALFGSAGVHLRVGDVRLDDLEPRIEWIGKKRRARRIVPGLALVGTLRALLHRCEQLPGVALVGTISGGQQLGCCIARLGLMERTASTCSTSRKSSAITIIRIVHDACDSVERPLIALEQPFALGGRVVKYFAARGCDLPGL
jgi:hypothetical protein